ncbi:MAG: hypothetical protein L0154_02740 [Chloroflexi bacterium]|nr:hypothetical protein [Chloroflexota bacterium]
MSDAYEDRDHNFDDDSGRRRRRRYMRYEDDAWGAAYQGDLEDGDAGDFDEWVGMVPEEASGFPPSLSQSGQDVWIDDLGGNVNNQVTYKGQDPLGAARRSAARTTSDADLGGQSPALERAGRLLNRYDSRRLANQGHVEVDKAKRQRQGDFIDSLFNFQVDDLFGGGGIQQIAVVVLVVLLIASLSCVAAAWFTAIEVREAMGLTEYIIRP